MGVTSGDGLSHDLVVSALLTPETPFSGEVDSMVFLLDAYPHVKFSTRSPGTQKVVERIASVLEPVPRSNVSYTSPHWLLRFRLVPVLITSLMTHQITRRFPERAEVFTLGVAPLKTDDSSRRRFFFS